VSLTPAALRARSYALRAMRQWFSEQGYLEVPTPALVPSAAMEANLFPVQADGGWLRTSPEFALKRVLASGLHRIYEIGPCFRDREDSPIHGREFLMLEWYRVGARIPDVIEEVQQLVATTAAALGVPNPGPWRIATVGELFHEHTGVDLYTASVAEISPYDNTWDDAFMRRWVQDVEHKITEPTFLTEWPASQAALSTVRTDRAHPFAERFEVYLGGIELANAFHELIDRAEQLRRCEDANAERRKAGEPENPLDPAFLAAVGKMPPTTGIALGVERLVAALMGWDTIHPLRVTTEPPCA